MNSKEIDREAPEWEELSTLFGGYLHQDWDVVHGDAWSAVAEYARESHESNRAAGARSLRQLLLRDDDSALERAVDHLGCAYYPPGDGYSSYRVWLTAVADFLDAPEEHPGPPERDAPMPG